MGLPFRYVSAMTRTRVQSQLTTNVQIMLLVRKERQADLASALGTTQANVSRKLANKVSWTMDDVEALSNHFNLEAADLFREPAELMSYPSRSFVGSPERDGAARRHAQKTHMHRISNVGTSRNKWSNTPRVFDYDLAA